MNTLWNTLLEAKLVEGNAPVQEEAHSPWYVQLLLAFSGWLAALFILGFIATGFSNILDSSTAFFVCGTLMIILAYVILKKEKSNFIEHLGLAISFAGQALIVIALFKSMSSDNALFWFVLMAFQTLLALLIPNYLHRLVSSFFAGLSLYLLSTHLGIADTLSFISIALFSYLWLHEFAVPSQVKKRQALAYGLALSVLFTTFSLQGLETYIYGIKHNVNVYLPYLSLLLTTLVSVGVTLSILKKHHIPRQSKVGLISLLSILLFTLLSLEIPGLMLSILLILLAFNHSNRVLLGLGIFALLYAASSYYYFLGDTLLYKSLLLAVMGLALLLGRWIIFHLVLRETKGTHV